MSDKNKLRMFGYIGPDIEKLLVDGSEWIRKDIVDKEKRDAIKAERKRIMKGIEEEMGIKSNT